MFHIKQSTALPLAFFAHDVNGDGVTGLVDGGFTKRISKNGGAFAAMTVTITEMENGWYSFPLSALHSDTTGLLSISFSHASTKRANLQLMVSARILDDLLPTASYTAPLSAAGVRSAVGLGSANLDTQLDALPTAAEVRAEIDSNSTKLDVAVSTRLATSGYTAPLSAAGVRSAVGLASANLDTQLGTLMTSAAYTAPDNASVTAIKAQTDKLVFTVANKLDVNVLVVNGVVVTGVGTAATPWGPA